MIEGLVYVHITVVMIYIEMNSTVIDRFQYY